MANAAGVGNNSPVPRRVVVGHRVEGLDRGDEPVARGRRGRQPNGVRVEGLVLKVLELDEGHHEPGRQLEVRHARHQVLQADLLGHEGRRLGRPEARGRLGEVRERQVGEGLPGRADGSARGRGHAPARGWLTEVHVAGEGRRPAHGRAPVTQWAAVGRTQGPVLRRRSDTCVQFCNERS
jgi:hypothetical protein